jgi:hypothetical protein
MLDPLSGRDIEHGYAKTASMPALESGKTGCRILTGGLTGGLACQGLKRRECGNREQRTDEHRPAGHRGGHAVSMMKDMAKIRYWRQPFYSTRSLA